MLVCVTDDVGDPAGARALLSAARRASDAQARDAGGAAAMLPLVGRSTNNTLDYVPWGTPYVGAKATRHKTNVIAMDAPKQNKFECMEFRE